MATNADFNDLIERIDVATTTLENSVDVIANGASDIEDSVVLAQQAAAQAQSSANDASDSADVATQQAQAATNLVAQLEAAVVLEEAPEDGQQYARQNGAWTVVETDSGEGNVTSVNNIEPDAGGNVTLSAADVGAKPSSYVPAWSEVTGKPSIFPTNWTNVADKPSTFPPSAHTHAAADVTSGVFATARIPDLTASKITSGVFDTARLGTGTANNTKILFGDGTWKDIPAPGNTPVGLTFTYNGVSRNDWPVADRFEAIDLSLVTVGGNTGAANFNSTSTLNAMPLGKYYFGSSTFSSGALSGKIGVITVEKYATQRRAWAFIQAISGDTEGKMFVHRGSDGAWLPVGV